MIKSGLAAAVIAAFFTVNGSLPALSVPPKLTCPIVAAQGREIHLKRLLAIQERETMYRDQERQESLALASDRIRQLNDIFLNNDRRAADLDYHNFLVKFVSICGPAPATDLDYE